MELNFKVLVGINVIIGIVSFIGLILSSIVHLSERFINQKNHHHDHDHDQSHSDLQELRKRIPKYVGVISPYGGATMYNVCWRGSSGITVDGLKYHANSPYGDESHTLEGAFKFEFTNEFESANDYTVVATAISTNPGPDVLNLTVWKQSKAVFYICPTFYEVQNANTETPTFIKKHTAVSASVDGYNLPNLGASDWAKNVSISVAVYELEEAVPSGLDSICG
ncbi:MAG: hypothetical protein CMO44_17735 [Verrucomicrobiales bacterium]|nr:hypothetical protein [Verrucomicrobiales bacterium]